MPDQILLPSGDAFEDRGGGSGARVSVPLRRPEAAEAASRTLEKPTPGRLRELVERIVRDRLADGQLDDCELTFKDLEKIIASVTRSLTGMLHGRIDYPDAPDIRRSASAV